jgi:hypothetical protein
MKVSILDDYFDTLRNLPCFRKLDGHEVEIWKDHVDDVDVLARQLGQTEALVPIRERTPHWMIAHHSTGSPIYFGLNVADATIE